ncbi:uncharacterized protein LOC133393124 [Anopheles gambiae]|uniref:uncharacterized protein LOC133393124 n=1 Tax=Anopheles gambiae TaxID=7165 RepID=UPI002AC9D43F|nr:uncharacterized protein LOC133393124 [Anopheles gambiae]
MPLADHWRMVERAISTAAEHKIGRLPRREKKEWFDEECRRALSEKNAARARMLRHETRQNVEIYRRLRKQQTMLFQTKQRRFEESDEQLLEQLSQLGDTRLFYRRLKEEWSGFAPKTAMCRDAEGNLLTDEREVIEGWKCYYEGYLNRAESGEAGARGRTRQPPQQQHSSNNSNSIGNSNDEVPPPSLDEIASAIKQLKSNKSAGSDGMAAELFKKGSKRLTVEIHQLIVKVWEQEELPEEWKLGVIYPVHKKGDRLDCSYFRAFTVLNAAYKILFQILFCKLAPLTTNFVGSYQAGFVGGKSTTDQIFTLRQILQKCRERQIPTHHLFIDFKAADDTIDRKELWSIMQRYHFPGKLIPL